MITQTQPQNQFRPAAKRKYNFLTTTCIDNSNKFDPKFNNQKIFRMDLNKLKIIAIR